MPNTEYDKRECRRILDEISDFIPHEYVVQVQEILSEQGIERKVSTIYKTRNGVTPDLKVMQALEKIARPIMKELISDKKLSLVEQSK